MDSEGPSLESVVHVGGAVRSQLALTSSALLSLPTAERRIEFLCSTGRVREAVVTGVTLTDVLDLAGVRDAASIAVFTCSDGYEETVPLATLIQQKAFLTFDPLEDLEDGMRSLPRLCLPGKTGDKWAKDVVRIELR